MTMHDLLRMVVERGASDLHIKAGTRPMLRIDGTLVPIAEDRWSDEHVRSLIAEILTPEQIQTFGKKLELDCAYGLPNVSRYRINIYQQRGAIGAAIRTIPAAPPNLDKLKLPKIVRRLAMLPRGLVLVTGPTGSGKSTTLAAIVDVINHTRSCHVVTIEDPIEYLHTDDVCIITQREVGQDTHSFTDALRHVLRQDPDVILIGEMRDLETIGTAITAAETGHLVLATLHTTSAPQTIDRIIDVFPPHQQAQVRMQLSVALEGVLSQTLLPLKTPPGRVAAVEVMVGTPAVRNLIREGKTHQLFSTMQAGAKEGMHSLNQALRELVRSQTISLEVAMSHSSNTAELLQLLGREGAAAAAL
jgi:twitching motility protein PilT